MTLYTIILFVPAPAGGNIAIKYRNINRIEKFIKFACCKYPNWSAANIYEKESRRFVNQIKNQSLPAK